MKKIKLIFVFILIVLSLAFITSCALYETPDGKVYTCENPYMKLYMGTQQEISIMEHSGEYIKIQVEVDYGGNFLFKNYIGSMYVPDLDGVYNLPGDKIVLSGAVRADNKNGLLYLYPDKKEYPDFDDVYVLKKQVIDEEETENV